jgi:hypothetical protein
MEYQKEFMYNELDDTEVDGLGVQKLGNVEETKTETMEEG